MHARRNGQRPEMIDFSSSFSFSLFPFPLSHSQFISHRLHSSPLLCQFAYSCFFFLLLLLAYLNPTFSGSAGSKSKSDDLLEGRTMFAIALVSAVGRFAHLERKNMLSSRREKET